MDSRLDTAPCGFFSFTDDGTVREINQTLLDRLGYRRDEVVGGHVEELLTSGAKLFYHTHFFPLLKMQDRVDEVYLSLQTAEEGDLSCLVNAKRSRRDDTVVNDVVLLPFEERSQYEDEILQAKQAAEQANQAKDKFLSTVTHELRTPLSTIKSVAQFLARGVRGTVNDGQKEYLDRIDRAADYLDTLIGDILDFARLEAGPVDVELEQGSLDRVFDRVESLLDVRFEDADITYERAGDASDVQVRADPDRLQQILLNLLTNAIKFTDPGGTITTATEAGEHSVQIHVRDTGAGIPEEEQEHIFDPFVQAGEPSGTRRDGVGLGLAISRDLAQAMDGTLSVESEVGVGSTFTVTVPRANTESAG